MKLIPQSISNLFKKIKVDEIREIFIVYRIVDSSENGERHKIQCINTRNIISLSLQDIIYNCEILYGLPPLQACGIGIQLAKLLTSKEERIAIEKNLKADLKRSSLARYGKYCLQYQDRNGKIFFIDTCTEEGFFKTPAEIALSKELISEFDASQAFHIGFSAGLMMRNTSINGDSRETVKNFPNYLKVIK